MSGRLHLPGLAVLVVVLVVLCLAVRPQTRLSVAATLAVPQVFVPGLPLPLAQLWLLAAGVAAVLTTTAGQPRGTTRPGVLLALLVLADLAGVLWSPDPGEALSTGLRLALFAVVLHLAVSVGRGDPRALARCAAWTAPWVLLQSVLVVLFRLDPAAEAWFLRSSAADWLVGPAADALFSGMRNNVLDPAKAGGLLVNGNAASLLGGLSLMGFLVAHRLGHGRRHLLGAAVCLAGVVMTGSKTGLVLVAALPLLALVMVRLSHGRGRLMVLPSLLLLPPATLLVPAVLARVAPGFLDESQTSASTRLRLWEAARELFLAEPLLGLGFGGWDRVIASYLGRDDYPPHNLVIVAWADAGLAAAVLTVAFLGTVLVGCTAAVLAAEDPRRRGAAALVTCAWLWVTLHGMGDNTTVYGENRSMVVCALLTALVWCTAGRAADPPAGAVARVPRARRPHAVRA